ncbi:hypothetical protein CAEBREN_10355 [Caenorhabditis brenneri]|uniref:Protein kinase domain-containing protein n=1 Tax=Caenorhabditis brenneri TaxID=135651 RepID=G0NIP2_CAEBE|nr:hypothetical protein CAEBREN_10355 [Caenorhabditis brenneri]
MSPSDEGNKPCEQCFKIYNCEIVKTLGSGSFGTVFLVKNSEGMKFAIKQIEEEHDWIEGQKALKEALHTNHPHCIYFKYSSWTKHDNSSFGHALLLMELCSEKTLDNWIDEKRKKPNDPLIDMKKWIWQILSALEWLNEKGVIHRDLKPNNVFFATDDDYTLGGTLKIGDFGMILRSIEANKAAGEYRQTFTKDGSDQYTAPEVLKGEPYNANADVYSLGIIAADLIHHLDLTPFENRNATFQKGKFPPVLRKLPEPAKDFLKKATAPSEDRPLAKELIKHDFFSDCIIDGILVHKLTDTLHKLEDDGAPSEYEKRLRENLLKLPQFSVELKNETVARVGVFKDVVEELLKHEIPKENLIDAATRIQTILECLTGSTDFSLKNTTRMLYYEEYLKDLYYYAERMKDQNLIFVGLETRSFKKLKESYVNGHVKLIPNLEVWMTKGCKEFMRSVFGNDGKIQFSNGNAPLHYMRRNDGSEYENSVESQRDEETSKQVTGLYMEPYTPLLSEPLTRRVERIGSFLPGGKMPDVEWSNYNVDVIRSYYRLLLAAYQFNKEAFDFDNDLGFSFSADIQEVIWASNESSCFLLPTIDLFVQEPVQNWESWTEISFANLVLRLEMKLSKFAEFLASPRFLELDHVSRVCIGSPTEALRMITYPDVNKEEKSRVARRIIALQEVLTHSNSFFPADGTLRPDYSDYSLETLVEYYEALLHYAEKLQDQKIVLFGHEDVSFDRVKEKRHVKMIPSIGIWMIDECKDWIKKQIESKGKIVFSNEDEQLEWIPRREELINLRGNFNEAHIHVEHDVIGNIRRRLKVMVNAQVPETAKQVTERIVSISTYLSGPTQLDHSGRAKNVTMDHGRGVEDLKNYLRLLIGASNFSIENSVGENGPEFFFNDDMETLATSVKEASFHLPTFEVFLEEPMEHWESWAEVSWKLWNTEDEVIIDMKNYDDKKKDVTPDAKLSSLLAGHKDFLNLFLRKD